MRPITTDQLTGLLADHEPPCISLYQPTHRNHPENQQDPIRYRNLLAEMENSLRQKYPTREVRTLLEKFQALARDDHFWNHRTDGLAILEFARHVPGLRSATHGAGTARRGRQLSPEAAAPRPPVGRPLPDSRA